MNARWWTGLFTCHACCCTPPRPDQLQFCTVPHPCPAVYLAIPSVGFFARQFYHGSVPFWTTATQHFTLRLYDSFNLCCDLCLVLTTRLRIHTRGSAQLVNCRGLCLVAVRGPTHAARIRTRLVYDLHAYAAPWFPGYAAVWLPRLAG